MIERIDPRWLDGRPHITVVGYAPEGPLYMFGPVSATNMQLDVPGVWCSTRAGVAFMVPDPEWLREHNATPDGEYWRIVQKSWGGAEIEFRVPAMWGLRISTEWAHRTRNL